MKIAELSFGGLLSETVSVYPKVMSRIFKILLVVVFLPIFLLDIIMNLDIFGLGFTSNVIGSAPLKTSAYLFLIGYMIVMYILIFLMYIMTVKIIKNRTEEKTPTISEALKGALKYLIPFVVLAILETLALGGLTILLVVPMIIMAIYWSFATISLIYDNKGIIESLGYSMNLVKESWWRTFGYMILFTIIAIGVGLVPGFVLGIVSVFLNFIPVVGPIISSVLSNLLMIVFYPIGIIFMVLFYEKLKESKGSTTEVKPEKPTAETIPQPVETK